MNDFDEKLNHVCVDFIMQIVNLVNFHNFSNGTYLNCLFLRKVVRKKPVIALPQTTLHLIQKPIKKTPLTL